MRTVLAIALVLAVASPIRAAHCETWTTTTFGQGVPVIEVENYYILVARGFCDPQCGYSFWVYEETNGFPGLQRDDFFEDDTCHGLIPADTIIF